MAVVDYISRTQPMSVLMVRLGDFVDGLVCVSNRSIKFGEGQSHCDQDCNNHSDRLDAGERVHL